jgi:Aminoglycoside/hydroxyurea antibiotic resistance kinase
VLLHGDLHHENVLRSDRAGWLAIDVAGVLGEPAFDVGALLHNPWPGLLDAPDSRRVLARRMDVLADGLGVDRDRVSGWGFAFSVLSAIWCDEDEAGGPVDPFILRCVGPTPLADLLDPRHAGAAVEAAPVLLQADPAVGADRRQAGAPAGHHLAVRQHLAVRDLQHPVGVAGADQPTLPDRPAGELGPDQVAALVVAPDRRVIVRVGAGGAEGTAVVVDPRHRRSPLQGCR